MKAKIQGILFLRSECGSSLVEMAVIMPVLLLILFGAVDFGRAYYLSIELGGAARSGAIYGSQYPTDTTGMGNAAKLDAPDVPGFGSSISWGCECSDGSGRVANCSSMPFCSTNIVYYVTVKTTAAYSTLFPWPGVPSSIALASSSTMRSGSTNTPF
jgi:Flp pilus assembly protein TadG